MGGAKGHLARETVSSDRSRLEEESERVRKYVDRHLAHHDADPLDELPTFAELDVAVDALGDLFKRYAGLLTASAWITLVPVAQYNWLAVFLEPWVKDEQVLFDINAEVPGTGRFS